MNKEVKNVFLSVVLSLMALLTIWMTSLLFKPVKIETTYFSGYSLKLTFHADGTYTKTEEGRYGFDTEEGFYICGEEAIILIDYSDGSESLISYEKLDALTSNPNTILFIVIGLIVVDVILIRYTIKNNRDY